MQKETKLEKVMVVKGRTSRSLSSELKNVMELLLKSTTKFMLQKLQRLGGGKLK